MQINAIDPNCLIIRIHYYIIIAKTGVQMSANECKSQEVKFLFSYDGRHWEAGEVEPVADHHPPVKQKYAPYNWPDVRRYGWADFREDTSIAIRETGNVMLRGTSAIIRALPSIIRVTGRIIQGAGYVIYWTAYGCIVIVASLISAFSIPIIRERPCEHPSARTADADVRVNVNVEVNVSR